MHLQFPTYIFENLTCVDFRKMNGMWIVVYLDHYELVLIVFVDVTD